MSNNDKDLGLLPEYVSFKDYFNRQSSSFLRKKGKMISMREMSEKIANEYWKFYIDYLRLPKFDLSRKTEFEYYNKTSGREVICLTLKYVDVNFLKDLDIPDSQYRLNLKLVCRTKKGVKTYSSFVDNSMFESDKFVSRKYYVDEDTIEAYMNLCRNNKNFIDMYSVLNKPAAIIRKNDVTMFLKLTTNPFEKPDKLRISLSKENCNDDYKNDDGCWINYHVSLSDFPQLIFDFYDTAYDLKYTMVIIGDEKISLENKVKIIRDTFDNVIINSELIKI